MTISMGDKQQQQSSNSTTESSSSEVFSSRHLDYVHHVAFDCYGRRMATCSGDRFVRIWDYVLVASSDDNNNDNNNESTTSTSNLSWQLSSEFQAHRGSVTKVTWCHSEFGTLVATCGSSDIKIWEEQTPQTSCFTPLTTNTPIGGGVGGGKALKSWIVKAHLTEARRDVTALEFCPRTFGLQLATGSADGICRMYEAVDLMNLSQWPMKASWSAAQNLDHNSGITCLSWCPSRFEPQTLALGTNTHVSLWRYHSPSRQYVSIMTFPKHPGSVLDVSWAPNVGRRFHWIASCENGGVLRVYQLKRTMTMTSDNDNDTNMEEEEDTSSTKQQKELELESIKILPTGSSITTTSTSTSTSWKCEWNVTGTVLATSGDGGIVQLWKCDTSSGQWKCVSEINGATTTNEINNYNTTSAAASAANHNMMLNNNTIGSNSSSGSTTAAMMMQLG